jgi:hypothetical protein
MAIKGNNNTGTIIILDKIAMTTVFVSPGLPTSRRDDDGDDVIIELTDPLERVLACA